MAITARDFGRSRFFQTGSRLLERRRQLGLNQADVVKRLDRFGLPVTDGTISNFERGQRIDIAKLVVLAAALECSVTYLLGLTEDPQKWDPDVPLDEATRIYLNAKALRSVPTTGGRTKKSQDRPLLTTV